MGRVAIQVIKNLKILNILHKCKTFKATARYISNNALKIQPSQFQKWRKEEHKLGEKAKSNPKSGSLYRERDVDNKDLENVV